jgi:hypothetical protein
LLVFDLIAHTKKGNKCLASADVVSEINSSSCSPAFCASLRRRRRVTQTREMKALLITQQELCCINHKINGPVSGLSANTHTHTHTQSQHSISLPLRLAAMVVMVWERHGGVVRSTQTHTGPERKAGLINQQKHANYRSNRLV